MTIAQWVRQALEFARRGKPVGTASRKLDTIQAAAKHSYPTADIDRMLAEIEAGYGVRQP